MVHVRTQWTDSDKEVILVQEGIQEVPVCQDTSAYSHTSSENRRRIGEIGSLVIVIRELVVDVCQISTQRRTTCARATAADSLECTNSTYLAVTEGCKGISHE